MLVNIRIVSIVLMTVLVVLGGVALPAVGASSATEATAQQESPTGCDYVSLYNQTISSVVSVQVDGGLGSGFVYRIADNDSTTTDNESAATGNESATGNGTATIVTNAHVVRDASTVTIQFSEEETRTGTVVGRDRQTDLAVIRVDQPPTYVEALDIRQGQVQHGRPVAALGNPFGFDETITHGIISGVNRSLPTQEGFRIPNTVQTDAPISSGNSGGPLVDCDGNVVGVNTAGIAARGAENIGFAISSSIVDAVVPELVESGEFEHAFLGITAAGVTPAIAEANDLDRSQGVIVVDTQEGRPAADVLQGSTLETSAEGRQVPVGGDVIVAVNGTTVRTPEDLSSVLLTQFSPGDEVTLTIIRDGERTNVTTTLTERPEPESP